MISLIISLIAIALVAALSIATIYYGGTTYLENIVKSEASTLITQSEQLSAAIDAKEVKYGDSLTTGMNELLSYGYISDLPTYKTFNWLSVDTIGDGKPDFITVEVDLDKTKMADVCSYVNNISGHTSTYSLPSDKASIQSTPLFGCNFDVGISIYFFKKL